MTERSPHILAIDIGTTRLKVALCSMSGELHGFQAEEIPIDYPKPRWAEVDPERWWDGLARLVPKALEAAALSPDDVDAIGLSGLMHALVPVDANGRTLAATMLWMDQRCENALKELLENHGDRIEKVARGLPRTTTSAAKLYWLKQERADIVEATQHFLLPKDFLRLRLTGEWATDPTDAGGTALLAPDSDQAWAEEYLEEILGVSPEKFPPIRPSTEIAGTTTKEAAAHLGLRAGIPVVTGVCDVRATLQGLNSFVSDRLCLYMGTAAWIARGLGTSDPQAPSLGATATFGSALRWYLKTFAGTDFDQSDHDELEARAARLPPGSNGVTFLPHLMGERAPYRSPSATGAFLGLTLAHGQADLYRAVLEGTACLIRHIIEDRKVDDATEIWCVGGGTASELWIRILASVTEKKLVLPRVTEAGLLGTAITAAAGIGAFTDVEAAASAWVSAERELLPEDVAACRESYARYRKLDDTLRPFYDGE